MPGALMAARLRPAAIVILTASWTASCEDRSYREIGAEIQVLTKRNDALVAPARERLVRFKRRAIPQIETALHTASSSGKLNLVSALELLGDETAIPILRHFAIYDHHGEVRAACESLLKGWAVGEGPRALAARAALDKVRAGLAAR
jgi:hypothetical protein